MFSLTAHIRNRAASAVDALIEQARSESAPETVYRRNLSEMGPLTVYSRAFEKRLLYWQRLENRGLSQVPVSIMGSVWWIGRARAASAPDDYRLKGLIMHNFRAPAGVAAAAPDATAEHVCPWPLTFANAPTVERDGKLYVRDDAFRELARRVNDEIGPDLFRRADGTYE